MEKNNIIILLLVIVIIALLVGIAAVMLNVSKEDSVLAFKSESILTEGDSINVCLSDAKGNPIANQTVNITITDKDNSNSHYSVVTNEKGVAVLKLDKGAGEYVVAISYDGNDRYAPSNATQKLTVKQKETIEAESSTTSESSSPQTYKSGLTDEEVEAYIQRDLDERAKNGVDTPYDYEGAREFYENVPPEGMV